MALDEIGVMEADWINLVRDRDPWRALVIRPMNFQAPKRYVIF
jgi:hypothetical protein